MAGVPLHPHRVKWQVALREGQSAMRRPSALLIALAITLPGLAACSGEGPITRPTSVPSISGSVSAPAITLPTRTVPEATRTSESETPEPPPAETVTRTEVRTETRTETATATVTETPVEPPAETVTQTETVTETATPTPSTSEPVAAAPEPAPTAASTTWWPWLLLAVLATAGIVWWLLRRRAAQRVLDEWDAELEESRREATWVEESLVTQVLSMPTTAEATQVWTAARPRLLAMDEGLLALEGNAPDERRRASAAALRVRLAQLVEAVGTDTAAGPDADPDDFRARRAAIDVARRDLRAVLTPTSMAGATPDAGSGTDPV